MVCFQGQGHDAPSLAAAEDSLTSFDRWSDIASHFYRGMPLVVRWWLQERRWSSWFHSKCPLHLLSVHWCITDWLGFHLQNLTIIGGTMSLNMYKLAQEIVGWSEPHMVSVSARYWERTFWQTSWVIQMRLFQYSCLRVLQSSQGVCQSSCQPVCNKGKHQIAHLCVSCFRSLGLKARSLSAPVGQSSYVVTHSLHLLFSDKSCQECSSQSLSMILVAPLWPQKAVPVSSGYSGGGTSWAPLSTEPADSMLRKEVQQRPQVTSVSLLEVIKQLNWMVNFWMRLQSVSSDIRRSTAFLYQEKWSEFFNWCCGRDISPCKATVQQIT